MRATLCYMEAVTHREMREHSGEILRRVEAGESIQVLDNGRVAALIVPPSSDPLTDLAQRGQLRPAPREASTLRHIRRRATRRRSEQILADSRERR
jgi:antitoxin (DNA-binding transcriptional repressor) of toxin-antitoxin stability system